MKKSMQLTENQSKILDIFVVFATENFRSPTMNEVAEIAGIQKSAVRERIVFIVKKGYLANSFNRSFYMTEKTKKRYGIMDRAAIKELIAERDFLKSELDAAKRILGKCDG